jgi:hypothetical protein
MHAAPEALRQIVHQYEVDQQQRIRFLFEIEVKPRPLSSHESRGRRVADGKRGYRTPCARRGKPRDR